MAVYLREFATQAAYEAAQSSLMLPNVSLIDETNGVEYNPSSPEPPSDPRLIAVYNVTSTSSPTELRKSYEQNIFKSMEIDGVMLDELVTTYTFDTTGVHTVKYELYDKTKLGNQTPVFSNGNLIEVIIPNGVINISNAVFISCSGLISIVIPDSVTSIGKAALSGCYNLTSITIPDSVTSIGNRTFNGCSSLTSIVSNATTAPTIQSDTFNGVKTGGILTVPSGSSGYDVWMGTGDYYLGKYNWTKVEK